MLPIYWHCGMGKGCEMNKGTLPREHKAPDDDKMLDYLNGSLIDVGLNFSNKILKEVMLSASLFPVKPLIIVQ